MSRSFRAWLIAAAAAVLAGCSSVKLAYNQLDWALPLYLDGFVGLDRAQRQALRAHVGELLHWHCGTQLAGYARGVRAINAQFQDGRPSPAALDAHYGQVLEFWRVIRAQAAPRVALLLAGATDEQIEELFARLEKDNARLRAELIERPEAVQRREARETLADRLEFWIGDFTPAQRLALEAWSREFVPNGAARLEFRQRWQAGLRQALERRDDPRRFAAEAEALIAQPERLWSEAYRATLERNRRQLLALLAELGATLTPGQRARLARRAEDWAAAFEQLACAPTPVQTATTAAAPTGAN